MSSRTRLSFDIKLNAKGETINIQISDPSGTTADNLALATWGSSEVLANLLHRLTVDLSSTDDGTIALPVLEIGAGTGLVGLSAAAAWRTRVVLSDLPPILPSIEANVRLNRAMLEEHGGSAACALLDWANPSDLSYTYPVKASTEAVSPASQNLATDVARARVILAADTVYDEDHPELLVNVVKARLDTKVGGRLIMCYPLRIGYLDHIRDLWERLEHAGLICIQEGRENIDGSWEEDTPYEWCVWRWRDVDP